MYMIDITRQLLLYSHILVFALAMAEVLHEDWRMLRTTRLDIRGLAEAAQRIKWLLILLWATGIPLIGLSNGWDFAAVAENPKLLTKVIVASALTVNGVLLHYVAFPLLSGGARRVGLSAALASVLGSISTVSWLYAAFVGAARLIAPKMTMDLFLGIYALMLVGGITVALLFMRQHVERLMARPANEADTGIESEAAAFKAIEVAMTAVGQAQNRLMAARDSVLATNASELDATRAKGGKLILASRNDLLPEAAAAAG